MDDDAAFEALVKAVWDLDRKPLTATLGATRTIPSVPGASRVQKITFVEEHGDGRRPFSRKLTDIAEGSGNFVPFFACALLVFAYF